MKRNARRARRAIGATVVLLSAALSVTVSVVAASSEASAHAVAATSTYGFNMPTAIASAGGHLWIANRAGNSVTETSTTGAWIRTINSATYGFNKPIAIVSYSGNVFVVNVAGSISELNATTAQLVRVIKGSQYGFSFPIAATVQGSNIWVVNAGNNSVTEVSATTGGFIRRLTNASYGFHSPSAIAVAGTNIWVTSKTGGSVSDTNAGAVTEFVASTGAFVRRVTASADGLQKPSGIAFDGTHLWISDAATSSVTELNASGQLVRVITNSSLDQNYGFDAPTVVVWSTPYVYVISPPGASPMVTQITAATAEGNWYECNTNTPDPYFSNPTGLVVLGDHVWVVSPGDNTLTELSLAAGGNRIGLFQ